MAVSEDYGTRMGRAVQAVHQMHVDVTKMITLLDKKLGRGPVLVRITEQARFSVNADVWMPEGMHRIYAVPDLPGRVEGITAVFLDVHGEALREPILLAGQAQFKFEPNDNLRSIIMDGGNAWCLWTGYLTWQEGRPLNSVVRISAPVDREEAHGKLEWVQVIAVPLYSIASIDDVLQLLDRSREGQ